MTRAQVAINGKFLSAPITGVHRVAIELANALDALIRENHVSVAALKFELLMPYDGVRNAVEVTMPRRIVGPLRHIPWEQLVLPFRHSGQLLLNLCNIGPMLSRNSVTMIHDAQVYLTPESYRRAFRIWYKLLLPIIGRRHRRILTVSEYSRRQIARYRIAPIERITVIPNGADHVWRVTPDNGIVQRLSLAPRNYVVGLANTQNHKNVALLCSVFSRQEMSERKLVLFGSASQEDFQNAGVQVPANVVFAGKVSDAELYGLLGSALCLGFPSLTEGFGLPPLEAMALGCPVVAAPCGALPEVCGDAAIYVAPDDLDGWCRAICGLADDGGSYMALIDRRRMRARSHGANPP